MVNDNRDECIFIKYNFDQEFSHYISPTSFMRDIKAVIIKNFPSATIFDMMKNNSAYHKQIDKFDMFKSELSLFYKRKGRSPNVIFYWDDGQNNSVFYLKIIMPFIFSSQNVYEIK